MKRVTTIGMLTSCTVSQLGGFNTLMYYSGTLFGLVGFNKPTLVSLVVGGTNFIFTMLNMFIIDKAGRRIILLVTVIGMVSIHIALYVSIGPAYTDSSRDSLCAWQLRPWHFDSFPCLAI